MRTQIFFLAFLLVVFLVDLTAQTDQSLIKNNAPNVFVDCRGCDINFIKEKIQFANFVRDRKEADIHILFTSQRTGGGGREYVLNFIGLNKFNSLNDTLKYVRQESDSDENNRQKLVHVIKLGLINYVAKMPIADKIKIEYSTDKKKSGDVKDDWNFWVYRIGLNGFFNGSKTYSQSYISGSISASRVTAEWKIFARLWSNYNESNYNYIDETITNIARSQRLSFSLIKSISDHWSAGLWTSGYSSIYSNIDIAASIGPGIEYDIYPYSVSNLKQIRIAYKLDGTYNKYREETIYLKTKEGLVQQELSVSVELVQPWGSISSELRGTTFLHDLSKNSLTIDGRISLKLFRGLSLTLDGRYSAIHNQLSLRRQDANLEEVLLQRTELETQYRYFGSIGFSYSFGSIFNNIVNPRFD